MGSDHQYDSDPSGPRTPPATDRRPPGPRGLPVLGSVVAETQRPFEFLTENANRYGDVVYWEMVNEPIYQLNHPEYIEYVLVEANQRFLKGKLFQELLGPVMGTGLLNSEGQQWRDQRHLIQPLFHPKQIAVYADIMTSCTERMVSRWSDGERIDVHEEMMGLTLEIIAQALLGVDIRRDIRTIGNNLDTVLTYIDGIENQLVPPWVPTPSRRRFDRALGELETVVYQIIDERRSEQGGNDIVSRMLAAEEAEDMDLSMKQLRDQVMTFLLAGHETTALVLTYTWYLLAMHPAVEQRLLEEVRSILDGETPSAAQTRDLSDTDRVITESMRLYPPVGAVLREPTEAVEIGGYRIPAGATIWMPQWVVHRDPRWYSDPLAFNPDRWTDEFRQGLPRLAYFPFAAGPRRCVGDRLALLEVTLVLTTVLQRCHLELRPETELDLEAAITTRPTRPVWMTIHMREP